MNTLKNWGHEIAVVLVAVWYAIGTAGENGLINLARTELTKHGGAAVALGVISVVLTRIRAASAAPTPGSGSSSTGS